MKIAIFGNIPGAHFLCQHLLQCDGVKKVYHLGAADIAHSTDRYIKLLPLFDSIETPDAREYIINAVNNLDADLILVATNTFQLWPAFQKAVEATGIPALLPTTDHALLEWSKITGKKLLNQLGIPTPAYYELSADELINKFSTISRPFVLKFDRDWRAGLQTVIITDDNYQDEYVKLVASGTTRYLDYFGEFTDQKFIVEEYIESGRELSYHALCNATGWTYLGAARDYKKRYNNDVGHNTTGMGAYRINNVDFRIHTYADKIVSYFKEQGTPYIGVLYLGIMINKNGTPIVLEINTRPGDPEFTVIAPGIKDNLSRLLYDAATNKELPQLTFTDDCTVSIRLVNNNYTLTLNEGVIQPSIAPTNDIAVSLNETRTLLHSVITTTAPTRELAADKLYSFLKNADTGDFTYRTDIGYLE